MLKSYTASLAMIDTLGMTRTGVVVMQDPHQGVPRLTVAKLSWAPCRTAQANAAMALRKLPKTGYIPEYLTLAAKKISKKQRLTLGECRDAILFGGSLEHAKPLDGKDRWEDTGYLRFMLAGGEEGIRGMIGFCDALKEFATKHDLHDENYPTLMAFDSSGKNKNSKPCGASTVEAGDECKKPVVVKTLKTERGSKKTRSLSASEEVNKSRLEKAKKERGNSRLQSVLGQIMSGKITTSAAAIKALNAGGNKELNTKLKGKILKALKEQRSGGSLKSSVIKTTKGKK